MNGYGGYDIIELGESTKVHKSGIKKLYTQKRDFTTRNT